MRPRLFLPKADIIFDIMSQHTQNSSYPKRQAFGFLLVIFIHLRSRDSGSIFLSENLPASFFLMAFASVHWWSTWFYFTVTLIYRYTLCFESMNSKSVHRMYISHLPLPGQDTNICTPVLWFLMPVFSSTCLTLDGVKRCHCQFLWQLGFKFI